MNDSYEQWLKADLEEELAKRGLDTSGTNAEQADRLQADDDAGAADMAAEGRNENPAGPPLEEASDDDAYPDGRYRLELADGSIAWVPFAGSTEHEGQRVISSTFVRPT